MKTQAIFICFVLAFANAAELNPYMENTEDIFAEIKESSFGKGMLSLLKVHTTMGNNQQAILQLLDEIKTHIESERDFDTLNWTAQKALMEQIIQDYETQETTNEALVQSQTQKIVDDKAALVISDQGVTDETTEVARLAVEITRAQDLIATETAAFNTRQSRDSQAIAACNAALDLLRGFCDDAETTPTTGNVLHSTMFLQVNALVDVTNTFKSLGDVKYLPLINALTMLAQTGDVATVNEVVVLITELRDQIQGAYDVDAATFPINLQAWQQTESDLTGQQVSANGRLTAYTATSATLTVTISDTEASLIIVTGLYDDAVAQLAVKRPELATAIANFADRQTLRTKQLSILAKIRNLFVQDTANFIQLN